MHLSTQILLTLSTLSSALPTSESQSPSILYAAISDGTVQTLNLAGSSLTVSSSLEACGADPSWLTLRPDYLYCSNEGTPGSLSSFRYDSAGHLTQQASVDTVGGDVSSVVYGNGKYIALAHYGHDSVSTYALPLTSSSQLLQNLTFPFPGVGPVPSRQDKGYPHEVAVDPSGRFLFSPDLGADVVRVFTIDNSTGKLTQTTSIKVEAGSGPRHIAFYQPTTSASTTPTYIYIVSELSNSLSSYRMTVNPSTLTPTFYQLLPPSSTLNPGANQSASFVAEVRVAGKTLTVSNRGDQSFGPSQDSLTVYTINDDGSLSNKRLFRSGGNWPRSFEISRDGAMVAVGNQNSKSVAVMQRDTASGAIGPVMANVTLSGQVIDVIWGW